MKLSELRIALKYPDMTLRMLAVLLVLAEKKRLSRDVAAVLEVPRPSICRAFDGLALLKLLKRERDEKDARDVWGMLTKKGQDLAREISGG